MRKVQHYHNLLSALQRALPCGRHGVHIAGGAVRDTILNRPIRDVDVFLGRAYADDAAALLRCDFGYVKSGEWRQYASFSDPMVECVAKFEKADETIPICLIALKQSLTPEENVGRFDFDVCMASWDGGELRTTDAFKRDVEQKTFTLNRADDYQQFAYSMVRFNKLTADRYQGWTLSVPVRFEGFVKDHAFRKQWYHVWGGDHFGFELHPQILRPKER
jgi:hypothetical protein